MDLLEQVIRQTDIVSLVSDHIQLDTRSRTPKGLCPFHKEKTPSFVVYPDKGSWYCYGSCSTGGNVITFVMKHEGVDFKQALTRLATRAGIPITDGYTKKNSVDSKNTESIYRINKLSSDWFVSMLNSKIGSNAKDYLYSRGLDDRIIKQFQIGFAPAGEITLIDHLKLKGLSPSAIADTKLINNHNGTMADFFHNRIVLPIQTIEGKIVGFGARAIDNQNPKYINTPQTLVFDKSKTLYAIKHASKHIESSSSAIIVEGYMDAITAHAHGFTNVVASMGAVTKQQIYELFAYMKNSDYKKVILCLDSDQAGINFMSKISQAVLEDLTKINRRYRNKLDILLALSPIGKDPDESIRASASQWWNSIQNAQPFVEYLISTLNDRFDLASKSDIVKAVRSVETAILLTDDIIYQAKITSMLADKVNISESQLAAIIFRPEAKRKLGKTPQLDNQDLADFVHPSRTPELTTEDYLIAILLQHPDIQSIVQSEPPDLFQDSLNRTIFQNMQSNSNDFSEDAEEKRYNLSVAKISYVNEETLFKEVQMCINRLQRFKIHFDLKHISPKLSFDKYKDADYKKFEVLSLKQRELLRQLFLRSNHA